MNPPPSLIWAAVLGAAGVALGAFGAHGLEGRISERALEVWHTANRYHQLHALALLALAAWEGGGGQGTQTSRRLWLLGLLLFSGGLSIYALSGWKLGAMVAPLGGLCLMGGWLALLRLTGSPR